MATVYSGEVSVGTYNRIRIKCDYSGTSATLTIQFRRTSAYSTTWSDSGAKLSFNGTTKDAAYSYTGNVGTSWVNLRSAISGYSVSMSGGTYNWSFTNPTGGVLGCSGSITIPSQATAPAPPTISASVVSGSQLDITWGTTDLGSPAGDVKLYYTASSQSYPDTLLDTKTTTGNTTYSHTGLYPNTAHYYMAYAKNTAGEGYSDLVAKVTAPAGISSITGSSLTTSSIVLTLVFASSGHVLTTTAQVSSNNTNWNDTSLTGVEGTTQTYSVTGLNANTQYTRYFRVHTASGNSAVKSFTWTTKPANITSATATAIGETTATVAVACGSSGSAATTNLQVSSDNTNWTTVANNVQGTTVDVSLTGLTPGASVTRYFRVHTVYGDSSVTTVTFTTLPIAHFYGSVNGETKRIKKLYGSVNRQTKTIKKVYASVNGQTKLIYRG